MKKGQKSIGTIILSVLILLALVPILIMLFSSYNITTNLLQERNHVTQISTTRAVITEKDTLLNKKRERFEDISTMPNFQNNFDLE